MGETLSPESRPKAWVAVAPPVPFTARIDEWAAGRSWLGRLPLLLYFAWVFQHHVQNPFYVSFLGGLNLGVHELGHFLFSPLGDTWMILGGSLTQCLLPVIGMVMFYRQGDYFAIAIAFCWLSTNLFSVSTYAADALTQQLALVSPVGGDPIHDWGYLLGRWNKLSKAASIGGTIRQTGVVAMLVGLAAGAWILWRMRVVPKPAD